MTVLIVLVAWENQELAYAAFHFLNPAGFVKRPLHELPIARGSPWSIRD